jgi:hypothetical protein
MPSVGDQFAAVFGALVPFTLAVGTVAVVIWKAISWLYAWRYGGVIERLEAQLRLVEVERRIASDRENNLASTVNSLVAELSKSKAEIEDKVVRRLEGKLKSDFDQLRQANNAVDEAVRRATIATTTATSTFFGPTVTVMPQPAPVTVQPVTPVAGDPTIRVAEKPTVTSRSE